MKCQAVVFDLFGTIVGVFTRPDYEKTLAEMASLLAAPYDEFVKVWMGTAASRSSGAFTLDENIIHIGRELKMNFSDKQIKAASRARYKFVADALAPKPHALDTLAYLKSHGYKTALISNCSTEPPVIWPGTPFAPLFDAAIFSSTSGMHKPDPRIYRLATDKLSVRPEACLYIGDGDSDELAGAAQVGMRAVLIRNPGKVRTEEMHDRPAAAWDGPVISSLKEVLDLLE